MNLKILDDIQQDIFKNRVLARVDWNVPIDPPQGDINGYKILDDSRMRANFATFDNLLERQARRIYIMTHLGRPQGRDEKLRTFSLKNHFAKIYPQYSREKFTVLDNIRFDPREEKNSSVLANRYAGFCKAFVNDAFSVSHRAHMSTVAIAKILPSCAGLQFQKEFENLSKLLRQKNRPFVVIIGGAKIEDKKPAILALAKIADNVLVGGKTALEAQKDAEILGDNKVVLALGGVKNNQGEVWDIDKKTIKIFQAEIKKARTIFWNGNLGKTEEQGFEIGSEAIARCITETKAFSVAAGGDTVAVIDKFKLADKFSYVSLAGGASQRD
ncbi:MAG: phosphoglycerate kinase [Candidatus Berkelbacteria bacterium Licking1014_7]|uniref:Phosphoglycerate kinase n=1 Tax=Candidatus Berkelbacteria bacterium Licking1014_7 TaxID=2017147 RepID=A0A554LJQ6_9BACT|nr:MAG: phosphoglycerate kinase [Candidatus Berkelbacteria bacterium Licking1014_7]